MNNEAGQGVVLEVRRLMESRPEIAAMLGINASSMASFADLAADVLAGLCQGNAQVRDLVSCVLPWSAPRRGPSALQEFPSSSRASCSS